MSERIDLPITGMTCAACATRIEKVLKRSPGVEKASVNFATAKGTVEYDPAKTGSDQVAEAIRKAGYDVAPPPPDDDSPVVDHEGQDLLKRLTLSMILGLPVVVIAMSHEALLPGQTGAWVQLILTLPTVFLAGGGILKAGLAAVRHGSADMNTLVSTGVLAATITSVVAMFTQGQHHHLPIYFEAAASVVILLLLGRYLEHRAKNKAGEAIRKLLTLAPKTARVLHGEKEETVRVAEVRVGDRVIVRAGESVPIDGIVREGASEVEEAMLTGESHAIKKTVGNKVFAGTLNGSGALIVAATGVGKETALAQIAKLVEEAQGGKAPIQRLADQVAGVFTPVVVGIAAVTWVVWAVLGDGTMGLLSAINVLVIACPCALGLATPTAILVGTGRGAGLGILVRDGAALERLASVDTVVLDKTGTLTTGRPEVVEGDAAVVAKAAMVEVGSEHPLAGAIRRAAGEVGRAEKIRVESGGGVSGEVDAKVVRVGKLSFASLDVSAELEEQVRELAKRGRTPVVVSEEGKVIGLIGIADAVKEGAKEAVEALKQAGLKVVMLTGDRREVALEVGADVGITEVIAEVLPGQKLDKVRELTMSGRKVMMVGDGINDAPALAGATVGVAMGSGADAARAAADLTLLRPDPRVLMEAIALSKDTIQVIRQNLFWAFAYNALGIPVAAGILYPFTGWLLSPMLASAAMAFSSLSVVLNSLRLARH